MNYNCKIVEVLREEVLDCASWAELVPIFNQLHSSGAKFSQIQTLLDTWLIQQHGKKIVKEVLGYE